MEKKYNRVEDLFYYEKKISKTNGIYDFLTKATKSDFDEIGTMAYNYEVPSIMDEIASCISKLLTNKNILDLGCGDGALARSLLKYEYNNLICLDSSIVMLNLFKSKLTNYNETSLTLIRADAHSIPLITESIDLVIVNNLFHLLDNPSTVLAEIFRILSPIGKLLLISDDADNYYQEDSSIYKAIVLDYTNEYWKLMGKNNYFPKKYNSSFNPYLEANKLFKKRDVLKTKSVEYEGIKTIQAFLLKAASKTDYSKLKIPLAVHLEVHQEIEKYLIKIYGNDLFLTKTNYQGRSTSIIDVYRKE